MREITHIVIHCSATRASQDIGASEIDRWHRDRGWNGIGYHFVVKRDGVVEAGRPVERAGAHVSGFNSTTIGVCLVGGVAEDGRTPEINFTRPQIDSAIAYVADLVNRYQLRIQNVIGHNEAIRDITHGSPKACPVLDMPAFRLALGEHLSDSEKPPAEDDTPPDWGNGMDDVIHLVTPGDTLWGISKQYDVPLDELRRLNPWLPADWLINPGDEIVISENGSG